MPLENDKITIAVVAKPSSQTDNDKIVSNVLQIKLKFSKQRAAKRN